MNEVYDMNGKKVVRNEDYVTIEERKRFNTI